MNKNKSLIITIIFMGFLVFSSAYAFMAASVNVNNTANFSINTASAPSFMAYSSKNLELNIDADDFASASTIAVSTGNGQLKVSLASPVANKEVSCTYDVKLVWSTSNQYLTPSVALPYEDYNYEISIEGQRTTQNDTTGHVYLNKNLNEVNLTSLSWVGSNGSVGRYAKVVDAAEIYSKSSTATVTTWNFNINFYCLPVSQAGLLGKNLGLYLTVDNIVC